MGEIYLAFLWHMHQPYYKNSRTNEYLLPWVLLHGTKDYYDMAFMLKDFDGLKQNFNVVPSLLLQLRDYENLDVIDTYLDILRKPASELNDGEKEFILMNFFNANWDNMIRPFPRYYELLEKRGFYYPREGIGEIRRYFGDEELRDIQILFFLSWVDPSFFGVFEGLKYLKQKGRRFSEEDKLILQDVQKTILKGIMPLYKELAEEGRMELSTSPFYHPIIPLLIDNRVAKEAMPDADLPGKLFSRPEDASHQIGEGIELFWKTFGFLPKGMWPPEGSVSDEALALYAEHGMEWLATDEEILFNSLKIELRRDGQGSLANPEILYKPYRYAKKDRHIDLVYRDKELSDLISFQYSRSSPKEAASDFLRRLKRIGDSVQGKVRKPLVTMAMDGENAWEHYVNDGRDFLQFLYEGILRDPSIIPVTISEYLKEAEEFGSLYHCFGGSWIAHNFAIWIGHVEDNTGWSLLTETRDMLEVEDPDRKNEAAWESIYAAEGSDWFWWYGDDHSSENDEIFDFLFRENLANAYHFLGKEPPSALTIPIILKDREIRPVQKPANFLQPVIDGKVTNYFEWIGAGLIEGRGHGVAMHEAASMIKGCYFGFNLNTLYLRVDVDKTFVQNPEELSFEVNIIGNGCMSILYHVTSGEKQVVCKEETGDYIPVEGSIDVAYGDILEIAVPFGAVCAVRGQKVNVWIALKLKDMEADRIPKRGYLPIDVPSETFEAEMWYV
jgi:alpha-amylase/alpha-mannosidase (GH57 family)